MQLPTIILVLLLSYSVNLNLKVPLTRNFMINPDNQHELGKYFNIFASFAYCRKDVVDSGECCPNYLPNEKFVPNKEGWMLIDQDYGSGDFPPYTPELNTYALFRNDIYKKIVLCFPGTETVIQLINEFIQQKLHRFTNIKYKDALIQRYFGIRSFDLLDKIMTEKNIVNMKLKEGYQLILIGHSLGGAVATSFLYYLADKSFISKQRNMPVLITFGQPRTGNHNLVEALYQETEYILRYVNEDDPVTMIPPCNYKIIVGGDCKKSDIKSFWHTEPSVFIPEGTYPYKENMSDWEDKLSAEIEYKKYLTENKEDSKIEELVKEKINKHGFLKKYSKYKEEITYKMTNLFKNLGDDMDKEERDRKIKGWIDDLIKFIKEKIDQHTHYFSRSLGGFCAKGGWKQ